MTGKKQELLRSGRTGTMKTGTEKTYVIDEQELQ